MFLKFEVSLKNISEISVISIQNSCAISKLFHIHLRAIIDQKNVNIDSIPGEEISIKITLDSDHTKYLNGIVTSIQMESLNSFALDNKKNAIYSIIIEPKLSLLQHTKSYRIFQKKSTNEIVKEILSQHNVENKNTTSSCGQTKREFCMQYNESDLNFIMRIMEEEGMFFYFTHEKQKQTMIITDNNKQAKDFTGTVYLYHQENIATEDKILEFSNTSKMIPKTFEILSFDSEKTVKLQKASANTNNPNFGIITEDLTTQIITTVDKTAHIFVDTHDSKSNYFHAKSTCFDIADAKNIVVKKSPISDIEGKKFFVTSYTEYYQLQQHFENSSLTYWNTFTSIPSTKSFKPEITTPKPILAYFETATVIGEKEDEVYTNDQGQVKVKFHWDKSTEKESSCWIRVMQKSAGNSYGTLYLPRIGQEVIVSFIKNNPNEPVIIGAVYNGKNKPKYLGTGENASKTVDYWIAQSVGSTNPKDRNEIKFENKKEKEKIEIHAQKDMDLEIENHYSQITKKNHDLSVEEGYCHVIVKKGDCLLQLDENNILIDVKKGKITVKSHGDIEFFSESNIKMHAKKNIEFIADENIIQTAKKEFNITAESYHSKITNKSTLEAKSIEEKGSESVLINGKNTDIKSTTLNIQNTTTNIKNTNHNLNCTNCKISATSTEIEGKAKANLQSSGKVTIKGTMIDLN